MIPDKQAMFIYCFFLFIYLFPPTTVNQSFFCHVCAAVSASQVSRANTVRKTSMSARPTPARTEASAKTLWTGKYHGNTELHFFHSVLHPPPHKLIMM